VREGLRAASPASSQRRVLSLVRPQSSPRLFDVQANDIFVVKATCDLSM
jgi:hypothetical protein